MEYAVVALEVVLALLVVTHSRVSYIAMRKQIKDPSQAIILRPNLGLIITLMLLSFVVLLFAYPTYATPTTTGSHAISGMMFIVGAFVVTFPLGWLGSGGWTCLEPGVAHVPRRLGFRRGNVYASQVRYWEGRTKGGAWWSVPVYDLDDPMLRLLRLTDVENKGLFGVYGPRNCSAVLDWVKAYCPNILVSLAYKKKPK